MSINKLEHYLILSDDIDATRDFYVDVLGLQTGPRPPFPFPGYWLYVDGTPCVHLASSEGRAGQREYLGRDNDGQGTGPIDHVAFAAQDLEGMVAHLNALGIDMIRRDVPDQNSHQVFITDPNGVNIELNFSLGEAR